LAKVRIEGVTKRFGEIVAVDDVSAEIEDGELFALLGPSGCGKTTLLRVVAGFELPDSGRVFFGGRDMTNVPPNQRGTGMVFQSYALWPHMTVRENIEFGLKMRKLAGDERARRVANVVELLRLKGLEDRSPLQLSGGQQQRVAVARALAIEPQILLMDEPLSNLDAKLRIETRTELKKIQRELGITVIYVTHDQEEAMSIADRMGVMNKGQLLQVGSPREIYLFPRSLFVADFIGQATWVEGTVSSKEELISIATPVGTIRGKFAPGTDVEVGGKVIAVVRPEHVSLRQVDQANEVRARVTALSYLGSVTRVFGRSTGLNLIADTGAEEAISVGQDLKLYFRPRDTLILASE
jgi:ABC-type Fe3+/spermidine/putrescine transport system ATPase subunit